MARGKSYADSLTVEWTEEKIFLFLSFHITDIYILLRGSIYQFKELTVWLFIFCVVHLMRPCCPCLYSQYTMKLVFYYKLHKLCKLLMVMLHFHKHQLHPVFKVSWVISVESLLYLASCDYHLLLANVLSVHAAIYQLPCWRGGLQWAPCLLGSSCRGFPTDRAGRLPLSYLREPVFSRQLRAVHLWAWKLHPWIPNEEICVCVCTLSGFCQAVNNMSGAAESWTLSVWSWCESKGHDMTELLFCYLWKQCVRRCHIWILKIYITPQDDSFFML